MPNDGKLNKLAPIMVDTTDGTPGQALIVNPAGDGAEFGNVAAGSGGATLQSGGGGPVIISYGWSSNQDWDTIGVYKVNIQEPSINHKLQTTELTGYVLDDYTDYALLSAVDGIEVNFNSDEIQLGQEFDPGDGADGDLILSGAPNAGNVWSCYSNYLGNIDADVHYPNYDVYADDTQGKGLQLNHLYVNSKWLVENFIGDDRCIVDNTFAFNQSYFEGTFKPGREFMIHCSSAPETATTHTNEQNLASVGRYEFVRVQSVDYTQRIVTWTSPKKNKYGGGGVTDLAIGGGSYNAGSRFIVTLTRVMNWRNVVIGNAGTGVVGDLIPVHGINGPSYWHSSTHGLSHYLGPQGHIFRATGTVTIDNGKISATHGGYDSQTYAWGYDARYNRHGRGMFGVRQWGASNGPGPNNSNAFYQPYGAGGGSHRSTYYGHWATGGGNFEWGAPLMTQWGFYLSGGKSYLETFDAYGDPMVASPEDMTKLLPGGTGGMTSSHTNYIVYSSFSGGCNYITAKDLVINPGGHIENNGGAAIWLYYRYYAGHAGGSTFIQCKNFINYASLTEPIFARGGGASGGASAAGRGRTVLKYVNWTGNTWSEPGFIPIQIPGVYETSGTATSYNMLSGKYVTRINSAEFYVNDLPVTTTLKARFSQDGISWYDSTSALNTYDTLSGGANIVDLSTLNWQASNFYYQLQFGSTHTDFSPKVESAAVNYEPNVYEAAGVWESNTVSYGNFWLQPRTVKTAWGSDDDAPYPKYQLIGDDQPGFNSADLVTLPAPGYHYQKGAPNNISNNVELDVEAASPWRKYWKVKVELGAGSDLTDTPFVNSIFLTTTSTVTPSAITIASEWTDTGTVLHPAELTDDVGIGLNNPSEKLEVAGNIKASGDIEGRHVNLSRGVTIGGGGVQDSGLTIAGPGTNVPSVSTSVGTQGEIRWEDPYMYLCVATNTWKRMSLSAW